VDYRAIIAIDSLELRQGTPPPRVPGFVMEWVKLRQAGLSANWTTLAEKGMFGRFRPDT
jgi:hypothetical protein